MSAIDGCLFVLMRFTNKGYHAKPANHCIIACFGVGCAADLLALNAPSGFERTSACLSARARADRLAASDLQRCACSAVGGQHAAQRAPAVSNADDSSKQSAVSAEAGKDPAWAGAHPQEPQSLWTAGLGEVEPRCRIARAARRSDKTRTLPVWQFGTHSLVVHVHREVGYFDVDRCRVEAGAGWKPGRSGDPIRAVPGRQCV